MYGDPKVNDEVEKLIDDEMVFKAAMTSDYSKITELAIVKGEITCIDSQNATLSRLGASLRKLDLSFNLLSKIEHLEPLGNLRELNLSFN